MTTDIDKLEDFGNSKSQMGDLDGDHPPAPVQTDVKCSTIEEVVQYYDEHQPFNNITIIDPN